MARVRQMGFLIALDDFGAGHSNFDRVWSIKPDIVKLDRSLVAGLAQDRSRQRVVAQMVSLLHECGSLVLMEGVETHDEALVALESDVDFVQGYYFGRPQPEVLASECSPRIIELHGELAQYRNEQRKQQRELVSPYLNAIGYTGVLLSAARSTQEACEAFLGLDLPRCPRAHLRAPGADGKRLLGSPPLLQTRAAVARQGPGNSPLPYPERQSAVDHGLRGVPHQGGRAGRVARDLR